MPRAVEYVIVWNGFVAVPATLVLQADRIPRVGLQISYTNETTQAKIYCLGLAAASTTHTLVMHRHGGFIFETSPVEDLAAFSKP